MYSRLALRRPESACCSLNRRPRQENEAWQSFNASGVLDSDVLNDSDILTWVPVQTLRVRDLITIVDSPTGAGRSGLSSIANTDFVITAVPEPGTDGRAPRRRRLLRARSQTFLRRDAESAGN